MLQAGAGLSIDELANPFVCLRKTGITTTAQEALLNLNDSYLRGVGLCLAGEDEAGLAALKEARGHSNAEVQYSAGLSQVEPKAGLTALAGVGLGSGDLVAVMQRMIEQPGIDPYLVLRILAKEANDQPETWSMWLEGASRLEAAKDWQAALDWLNEGLMIAPPGVRGSLYLQAGRIYQMQSTPQDYESALALYNQALEKGGWLNPNDEANTHLYRGEVYRLLDDQFDPNLVLAEYEIALKLQPGSYWAFIDIGQVYLYDLKDLDQAEAYFQQALAVDEQSPYVYFYIGEVYRVRGDKEDALDWYRHALERQPNWQPAMDRLQELEGK